MRALIGELRGAEERQERGEPPHLPDMILRLMRVAVARNTELEVRSAREKDDSVQVLAELREEVLETVRRTAAPWRRHAAVAEVDARFAAARFPFRHDRALPATIVRGDPGKLALDATFRAGLEWPLETKRALVDAANRLLPTFVQHALWRPKERAFIGEMMRSRDIEKLKEDIEIGVRLAQSLGLDVSDVQLPIP